jgi:cysteine synthase
MLDWDSRRGIAEDITEVAGLTPLVKLRKVAIGPQTLCGKLELLNPTSSLKDRILRHMVRRAEERGELRRGMTIIEASTGSTGIATAMIGAVKGYRVIIVMPEGMSAERKASVRAYGAELVLTPGGESDVDLCFDQVARLKEERPGEFWEAAQFSNRDNIEAHYLTTGPEIWEQTDGKVDVFVASQGSGGTISGVGKYLEEQNPQVKIYAVEPAECPIIAERLHTDSIKLGFDHELTRLVDKTFLIANLCSGKPITKKTDSIKLGIDHKLTRLIDVAPFISDLYISKPFSEDKAPIKPGIDHELACLVDETPLIPNVYSGKPFVKVRGIIKLKVDHDLARPVDVTMLFILANAVPIILVLSGDFRNNRFCRSPTRRQEDNYQETGRRQPSW